MSDPAGPTSSTKQRPPAIFSSFLMNDIPRGTPRGKLARFLLAQSSSHTGPHQQQPQVVFGSAISDSRLDDELSVATLEFSDTPAWLLNQDPSGFPKHTLLGTIWRGVDRHAIDTNGRSEFIRAVMNSHSRLGLYYAEMLAEFADTDVNIQDEQGRTALHWACAQSLPDMVRLCLSVPDCATGLRDNDGLTAFDIALHTGNESLPSLFYSSMFEIEKSSPQVALLRVLTLTSDETRSANKPLFPGEALFQPVGERNSPLVVALLDRGVVLTTKDDDGNTALHSAAGQVDNVEIVTRLLEAGSSINAIGNRGSTPLHSAVRTADAEMVRVLLRWKADVGITDEDEMSALHLAAQNGKLDIARVLVQGGADVRARDGLVRTAAEVAEANREVQIVELLNTRDTLEQRGVPDPSELPLDVPVLQSSPPDLEVENQGGSTNLLEAAREGDLERVRALLAQGADTAAVDQDSYTALHLAAEDGHTEIIECLLAHGANTEASAKYGITALHSAILFGHSNPVEALLAGGAQTEANITMPISRDLPYPYPKRTPKGRGRYRHFTTGHTALHLAARNGEVEILKILLVAGAQTEAEDETGNRPLHCAARSGHLETVKVLLAGGAEMEAVDHWDCTPLHKAVHDGDSRVLKELLTAGANVKAVDSIGWTAFHHAVAFEEPEIVQILLSAGVEIDARTADGKTAYTLASERTHKDIVKMIGAQSSTVDRLRSKIRHLVARSE